jgi:hypothetical protein
MIFPESGGQAFRRRAVRAAARDDSFVRDGAGPSESV